MPNKDRCGQIVLEFQVQSARPAVQTIPELSSCMPSLSQASGLFTLLSVLRTAIGMVAVVGERHRRVPIGGASGEGRKTEDTCSDRNLIGSLGVEY